MAGHTNHEFYFDGLSPIDERGGAGPREGSMLATMINEHFGSFLAMKRIFIDETRDIKGEGWGWLAFNKNESMIEYHHSVNETRLEGKHLHAILGIDAHYHAYKFDYEQNKEQYLTQIFKIINWDVVETRLDEALEHHKQEQEERLKKLEKSIKDDL